MASFREVNKAEYLAKVKKRTILYSSPDPLYTWPTLDNTGFHSTLVAPRTTTVVSRGEHIKVVQIQQCMEPFRRERNAAVISDKPVVDLNQVSEN